MTQLCFLGPQGSYSNLATRQLFASSPEEQLKPCQSFEDIFAVCSRDDYAILPLENNTAGAVDPAIDLLIESPTTICAEHHLKVISSLLSTERQLESIDTLYSMVQPYYQSRSFTQKHLKHARWVQCPSSSDAIQKALEHGQGAAAIGLAQSGLEAGLPPLRQDIQDRQDNHTRFVVLSHGKAYEGSLKASNRLRSSIVFTLEDRPGTLLETLEIFKEQSINMSHIESRPSKDPRWNYNFLVTLESEGESEGQGADDGEQKHRQAIERVQSSTPWSRHLGTYPLLKPT